MSSPIYINNGETYGTSASVTSGAVGIGTTTISSGVKLEVSGKARFANGTSAPLNVPILASDPGSPVAGDVWIRNTSGSYTLKVRVDASTTKSVALS